MRHSCRESKVVLHRQLLLLACQPMHSGEGEVLEVQVVVPTQFFHQIFLAYYSSARTAVLRP